MNNKHKITLLLTSLIVLFGIAIFLSYDKKEKVHTLKSYYPDKTTRDVFQYIIKNEDTIFEGKFIQYNTKGNKIAEGRFLNGHIKGKSIYYFDSGIIKSIHYRKNVEITEESTYNYPNGKVMKYLMYDDFGILDFLIRYDELGNMKSYEGLPLIEIYQYKIANKEQFKTKIKQHLKVGDTLKQQYLIANIPNAKRTLKIENQGVDNTKVNRTLKKMSQTGLEVKEILIKKGINKIKTIVKYEFNDKGKSVINDTVSFVVEVH
jgi:antitoxin component YwqK of YwqJK toxin-antitoxin module